MGWWIFWLTGAILFIVALGIGWSYVSYRVASSRRRKAIEGMHWEISESPVAGGKVRVDIVKVIDWGGDQDKQVVDGPEHIMLVDPNDPASPSLQDAYNAATLRMATYNSLSRYPRRG